MNKDLKIAVCYSGKITDRMPYISNIKSVYKVFGDQADYFFSTWDLPENKKYSKFMNFYYPEPKFVYNPYNQNYKKVVKYLRKQKELGMVLDREQVEAFKQGRNLGSKGLYQFYAHANIFKDVMKIKDYDIIVRVRYDVWVKDLEDTQNNIRKCVDLVWENKKPIGFEYYRSLYVSEAGHPEGGGHYEEMPTGCFNPHNQCDLLDSGLHDWLIIHRADHCHPEILEKNIERRVQRWGEGGWNDFLMRPYKFTCMNTSWLDYVLIRDHRSDCVHRRARRLPRDSETQGLKI